MDDLFFFGNDLGCGVLFEYQIGVVALQFSHAGDESIAVFGNRLNIPGLTRRFPKSFSQEVDAPVKVVFLDEAVGPYSFHQLLLFDEAASVFEQQKQSVEGLRREWYDLPVFQQRSVRRIEMKRAEVV